MILFRFPGFLFVFLILTSSLQAQVAWVTRLDEALKQAAVESKFVVVDIGASWCPPCQEMAREVYPDKDFIQFSRGQIFMLLDAEKDSEGVRLSSRFDVHVFPTILVLNSKGEEINRLTGGRTAQGLINDLKEIFANPIPYRELVEKAKGELDNFTLQYTVGQRALNRKDLSRARQFLQRAADLSQTRDAADRVNVLMLLSIADFQDGKYQESIKVLDELERLDARIAQHPQLKFQRARALTAMKRFDEASKVLNELLRSTKSRSDLNDARKMLASLPAKYRGTGKDLAESLDKAREELKKGKSTQALELAGKAVEAAPQSPEAHMLLATAKLQQSAAESDPARKSQYLAGALKAVRMSRRLDPDDMLTYQSAKRLLAARIMPDMPNSKEAQRSYLEAEALFGAGQYAQAIKQYTKTQEFEPSFGKAYLHMGDCYFAIGHMEEALKSYREAAVRTPLDPATYRFAADALRRSGKSAEARQQLILSLLADPEYPMVWKDLDGLARSEGKDMERHSDLIPLPLLLAGGEGSAYDEGVLRDLPAQTIPAWQEYVKSKLLWRQERFAKIFPKEPFYHTTFKEELDSLNKLIEKWDSMRRENRSLQDPSLDLLRQMWIDGQLEAFIFMELFTEEYRGVYELWKKENPKAALVYIDRYLMGSPRARSDEGYNSSAIEAFNAGIELYHKGEKEQAIDSYHRALAQEPRMVPALQNLSLIFLELNDRKNARETLKLWMEAEPESARPPALLAQFFYDDGDYAGAKKLLERALSLEKDAAEKQRLQQNLAAIDAMLARKKP